MNLGGKIGDEEAREKKHDMLDNGPIITQGVININHDYSWQDMKRAGQSVEKDVLLKALELAFEDRIFIHKNKTVIF